MIISQIERLPFLMQKKQFSLAVQRDRSEPQSTVPAGAFPMTCCLPQFWGIISRSCRHCVDNVRGVDNSNRTTPKFAGTWSSVSDLSFPYCTLVTRCEWLVGLATSPVRLWEIILHLFRGTGEAMELAEKSG